MQKMGAEGQKPEQCAQPDPQVEEHPEVPPPRVEGEEQQGAEQKDAVERVQQPCQRGRAAAEGAEEVVGGGEGNAQGEGQAKLPRLEGDGQLHQPNRRWRKPPPRCSSS